MTLVVLALMGAVLVVDALLGRRAETGVVRFRWTIVLEVSAAIAVVAVSVAQAARSGFASSATQLIAGGALFACGAWLRRRARLDMGPYWSLHVEIRPEHRLNDGGLYACMRHPAYLGLVLELAGLPIALGSGGGLVACAALVVPAVLLRTRLEEHALEEHLGEPYSGYRRRTAAFVPLPWRRGGRRGCGRAGGRAGKGSAERA